MKFISHGSPSMRVYIDKDANTESVRFASGELETDDQRVIAVLKRAVKAGSPIEVVAEPKGDGDKGDEGQE